MFRSAVLFSFITFLFLNYSLSGSEDEIGSITFVGVKACKECHGEDAIGNQYKIWTQSPHARAYNSLLGEKASLIAKKTGVASPEKDTKCLKCHATGEGAVKSVIKEGVGCEACHGPGSLYHLASNHVDYSSRENGYRRGIKYGMYPILGITSLKSREKLCLSCHRNQRPCFPENANKYQYKIPIQTIDTLWKGDVNFRHPLRR